MNYIKPDISTVCMGLAASAASVILAGGTEGKRYSLPNARIMLHQPSGGMEGTVADMERNFDLIVSMRTQLNGLLADFTCLLYTSPSPRDCLLSRMPSSA